jgi:SulP family sulfate permease
MAQSHPHLPSDASARDRLLSGLFAGLVIGLITVFIEISFASLAFGGALAPYLGAGIGYLLVGAFVMSVIVALTSSTTAATSIPQDTTAALLSLVAGAVAGGVGAATDRAFVTVVVVMVIASLLTGLCFLLLGWFRLGRLVRFIPYPVIAGFLSGTGWFLVKGGVGLLAGESLTVANLGLLVQPQVLAMLLPGLVFALAFRLLGRIKHFLAVPAVISFALALFYVVVWLSGRNLAQMAAGGWLLGPFSASAIWRPPTPALLAGADWSLALNSAGTIVAIIIINTVALLMNASALEVALKRDINFDRELRAGGLGNLLAGLFGAPPGYQAVSLIVLSRQMGARSRIVGVVAGLICLSALLVGTETLALLPRFVFGGLILHLGFAFLGNSLVAGWSKLPRFDYAVVIAITVVMAAVGVLPALLVGFMLTMILFVIEYSRMDVVKNELTGVCFHSRVDRSPAEEAILRTKGDQVLVLRLRGFIFFGTAESLLARVHRRLHAAAAPLDFLVLDFQAVRGVDVSALNNFVRLAHLAEANAFHIILSALSPQLSRQMTNMALIGSAGAPAHGLALVASDLDQAMEHCEEEILAEHRSAIELSAEAILAQMLSEVGPDLATFEVLSAAFERVETAAGDVLIRQGDQADAIYLLASGRMDVLLESAGGPTMRVRKIGPGAVVGEIGYYLDQVRGATIVASQPCVLYRLSAATLTQMESASPIAAAAFHRFIAHTLAERVVDMNKLVQELQV